MNLAIDFMKIECMFKYINKDAGKDRLFLVSVKFELNPESYQTLTSLISA